MLQSCREFSREDEMIRRDPPRNQFGQTFGALDAILAAVDDDDDFFFQDS